MPEDTLSEKAMLGEPLTTAAAGRPWAALTRMTLVQIAATSAILSLTALAPAAADTLDVGAHWIGYQISFIYFTGLFSSLSAGGLVARIGAERVVLLILMLLLSGLALLVAATPLAMIAGSALMGLAYGVNNPASSVILHRVVSTRNRSLVFSIKQSGVPVGAVIANAGLPILALWFGGWRWAVLSMMVLPAILMIVSLPRFGGWPNGTARGVLSKIGAEQRMIFSEPGLRALALLGGLFSAVQLTVTAFTVVALVDLGWSLPQAGAVGAALQVSGAIGRIGWGLAADRVGAFRILSILGFFASGLSILLIWQAVLPAAVLVTAFVGLGACATGWNGVFLSAIARDAPSDEVGAATGAILAYIFVGSAAGPSIFALLYGLIQSYPMCFGLMAAPGLWVGIIGWRRDAASVRVRT